MQRKIFIGIDLPPMIKRRLMQKIEKWQEFPVRWSREKNLHITLSFLGYVDDELLVDICEEVGMACVNFNAFDIDLDIIKLGPKQEDVPKMFWVTGKPNKELKRLQENIEKELGIFQAEKKKFCPHITLGRIRKFKWQELNEIPQINEEFKISVPIDNVEIFESRLENGKRKFAVIESCSLAN